jgi:hypothetical protein
MSERYFIVLQSVKLVRVELEIDGINTRSNERQRERMFSTQSQPFAAKKTVFRAAGRHHKRTALQNIPRTCPIYSRPRTCN